MQSLDSRDDRDFLDLVECVSFGSGMTLNFLVQES